MSVLCGCLLCSVNGWRCLRLWSSIYWLLTNMSRGGGGGDSRGYGGSTVQSAETVRLQFWGGGDDVFCIVAMLCFEPVHG